MRAEQMRPRARAGLAPTYVAALSAALLAAACADDAPTAARGPSRGPSASAAASDTAPLYTGPESAGYHPGRYIVVFKYDVVTDPGALTGRLAKQFRFATISRYTTAVKGFAAKLPPAAVEALRRVPEVAYIEQDHNIDPLGFTQGSAPSHLDRIDQRTATLNGAYYYGNTGAGVRIYVIDTGIQGTHNDFWTSAGNSTSRVVTGRNFWLQANDTNTSDCWGHGTRMASAAGGLTYGVAKGVTIIPVKVYNCPNDPRYLVDVVSAVDWVTANHVHPAVVNMSLGGGVPAPTLDDAVRRAVAHDLPVVVGAGNAGGDACSFTPGRVTEAITVGATTITDARWSDATGSSAEGPCVDLFAPGVGVTLASIGSNTATLAVNGTSPATAQVSGAAALYLYEFPYAPQSEVRDRVVLLASNVVTNRTLAGTTDRLLYTYFLENGISGVDVFPASSGGYYTAIINGGKPNYSHLWYVDNVLRCSGSSPTCYFSITPGYHRLELRTTDATGYTRSAFKYFQAT